MWKLGRIFGIDVSIHWTLMLLVGWIALSAPFGSPLFSATLISAVFGCVLLHELGHSLAARQFGIETSSIVLLPIGGIASLEQMPREPKKELWIAVAGPLVNVVIASALLLLRPFYAELPSISLWLDTLMQINIGLVIFNMIPAFPMDGGRVFRATAARFLPYVNATNLAASVGRVMALLLGFAGILTGKWMLLLIAVAVYFLGRSEALAVASDPANYYWPELRTGFSSARTSGSHVGQVFRARRNGRLVFVVWDEAGQVYRCAQ